MAYLRASEAYAMLEANITGGCIQADYPEEPLCASLIAKGLMYRAKGEDMSPLERRLLAEYIPRTFFLTDKGRRTLRRTHVLAGRVGYNRGDCFRLWAEGD